jgi:hypothetical protein
MTAQDVFDAASKGGFNDLATVLAICRRHGDYCVKKLRDELVIRVR